MIEFAVDFTISYGIIQHMNEGTPNQAPLFERVASALGKLGQLNPGEPVYNAEADDFHLMVNPRKSSKGPEGSFDVLVTIFPLEVSPRILSGHQVTATQEAEDSEPVTKELNIRGQCVFHGIGNPFTLELSLPKQQ